MHQKYMTITLLKIEKATSSSFIKSGMEKRMNATNLLKHMSKKECQRLEQLAYFQAGKIVVQTLLPQHPPVALIALHLFGVTSSTSADTYIPIDSSLNNQCCSFFETRVIGLYSGKAASLLLEYQYQVKSNSYHLSLQKKQEPNLLISLNKQQTKRTVKKRKNKRFFYGLQRKNLTFPSFASFAEQKKQKEENPLKQYANQVLHFAGTGNNPFQSNIGINENKTAHYLATVMVNNWNLYSFSLIKSSANFFHYQKPGGKTFSFNTIGGEKKRSGALFAFKESKTVTNQMNSYFFACLSFARFQKKHTKEIQKQAENKGSNKTDFVSQNLSMINKIDYSQLSTKFIENRRWYAIHLNELKQHTKENAAHTNFFRQEKKLTLSDFYIGNPFFESYLNFFFFLTRLQNIQRIESKENIIPVSKGLQKDFKKTTSFLLPEKTSVKNDTGKQYKKISAKNGKDLQKFSHICFLQSQLDKKASESDQTLYNLYKSTIQKSNGYLQFAISQSRYSLKLHQNAFLLSNNARLSVEDVGTAKQRLYLWIDPFQLVNLLQYSTIQRDRFYPNWFRLYLPDIEATEFLKNIANSYFSLGLQTLMRPSVKELTRFMYFHATSVKRNYQKHSFSFVLQKKRKENTFLIYNKVGTLALDAKQEQKKVNFTTKALSFFQNVFISYGHNNLNIGVGFLRSMAKRRNQFNEKNLSISICVPNLVKNYSFEKNKQIFPQFSSPNLSLIVWGFSRPWKINRFVNIANTKRISCFPFFDSLRSSTCTSTFFIIQDLLDTNKDDKKIKSSALALLANQEQKAFFQKNRTGANYGEEQIFPSFNESISKEVFENEKYFFQLAKLQKTQNLKNQKEHLLILQKCFQNVLAPSSVKNLPTKINWKTIQNDLVHTFIQQFYPTMYSKSRTIYKTKFHSLGKIWNKNSNFLFASSDNISQKKNLKNLNACPPVQLGYRDKIFQKILIEKTFLSFNDNNAFVSEKNFIYHDLVNNCLAQAFLLVNRNRQIVDYFVDYLIRFQVLRQHQILYLFSTIILQNK